MEKPDNKPSLGASGSGGSASEAPSSKAAPPSRLSDLPPIEVPEQIKQAAAMKKQGAATGTKPATSGAASGPPGGPPQPPPLPGKPGTAASQPTLQAGRASEPGPMSLGNAALVFDPAPEPKLPDNKPQQSPPPPPEPETAESRRAARRRPAGPPRERIAANDDAPSIGGLIFALNQRPSNRPFVYAAAASGFWVVVAVAFAASFIPPEVLSSGGMMGVMTQPWFPTLLATIAGPIALFWFLAVLAWRSEELHMRSTAMTEVAVRLAEPDRMAEQSVASLGQAVRRQVSFMNDAVSRALGRAGELEALVHNEVSALEQSYDENERKIRGLISELAGERHALVNTGERFQVSLQTLGKEVPELIEKLGAQQLKLTKIIEGAGENLTTLENALATQTGRLETSLGDRTSHLQTVLQDYTDALGNALGSRTDHMQAMLGDYTEALGTALTSRSDQLQLLLEDQRSSIDKNMATLNTTVSERVGELQASVSNQVGTLQSNVSSQVGQLQSAVSTQVDQLESTVSNKVGELQSSVTNKVGTLETSIERGIVALEATADLTTMRINESLSDRTEGLQTVFEEYALALDATLANRAEALDAQLVDRTRALDEAFSERLRLFDESILRSTMAIDDAVGDNAKALTSAMETHAREMGESIAAQAEQLDATLMQGLTSVRATSENISRQSIKAIEGLANQADLLRNVSENLLSQINNVTNRFESQGQSIMRSANALEATNHRISQSLQGRTEELNDTLGRMSGKAEELARVVDGYSSTLEGSLTQAEERARLVAQQIGQEAEARSKTALEDLRRVKIEASRETDKALEDLRNEFTTVSREVTERLGSLTHQFSNATGAVREQAAEAARGLEMEQARLKEQLDRLPGATQETASHMRKALSDQLRALDQLSSLATRSGQPDVALPRESAALPPPGQPAHLQPNEMAPARPTLPGRQSLSSLTSTLARELNERNVPPAGGVLPTALPGDHRRMSAPDQFAASPPPAAQPPAAQPQDDRRDAWSLGDLLARASETQDDGAMDQVGLAADEPDDGDEQAGLDIQALSKALDPTTAAAVWSRFQAGQRGFMIRSIYSPESRKLFDSVARRYRSDDAFRAMVNRFLDQFQNELTLSDQRDPSGQTSQEQVTSDTGRVYLVLAHASGRLV